MVNAGRRRVVAGGPGVSSLSFSGFAGAFADRVPKRRLLNSTVCNATRAVGPAIAGLLVARWGVATAFLVTYSRGASLATCCTRARRPP